MSLGDIADLSMSPQTTRQISRDGWGSRRSSESGGHNWTPIDIVKYFLFRATISCGLNPSSAFLTNAIS